MSAREEALATGLAWLYDTGQPDGALVPYHGETLRVGDRKLTFVPVGAGGRAVIAIDVADVSWGPGLAPLEGLEPGELEQVAGEIAAAGALVGQVWGGHPSTSGCVALLRPVHASLWAAVARFRAGCRTHPEEGIECGCGWDTAGRALAVRPCLRDEANGGRS